MRWLAALAVLIVAVSLVACTAAAIPRSGSNAGSRARVTIVVTTEPPPEGVKVVGPTFPDGFWIIIYTPKFAVAVDPREFVEPSLPG